MEGSLVRRARSRNPRDAYHSSTAVPGTVVYSTYICHARRASVFNLFRDNTTPPVPYRVLQQTCSASTDSLQTHAYNVPSRSTTICMTRTTCFNLFHDARYQIYTVHTLQQYSFPCIICMQTGHMFCWCMTADTYTAAATCFRIYYESTGVQMSHRGPPLGIASSAAAALLLRGASCRPFGLPEHAEEGEARAGIPPSSSTMTVQLAGGLLRGGGS